MPASILLTSVCIYCALIYLVLSSSALLQVNKQKHSTKSCEVGFLRNVDVIEFSADVILDKNAVQANIFFLLKEEHYKQYYELLKLNLRRDCGHKAKQAKEWFHCQKINATAFKINVWVTANSKYSGAKVLAYVNDHQYKKTIQLPHSYEPTDVSGSLRINGKNVSTQFCNAVINDDELIIEFDCDSPAKPCKIEILEHRVVFQSKENNIVFRRKPLTTDELYITIKYAACRLDGKYQITNCHIKRNLMFSKHVHLNVHDQKHSTTQCQAGFLRDVDEIGFSADVFLDKITDDSLITFYLKKTVAKKVSKFLVVNLRKDCGQRKRREKGRMDCKQLSSTSFQINVWLIAYSIYNGAQIYAYVNEKNQISKSIQLPYSYEPLDVSGSLRINGKNVSTDSCSATIEDDELVIEFDCKSSAKPCKIEISEQANNQSAQDHIVFKTNISSGGNVYLTIKYAACRLDRKHKTINCHIKKNSSKNVTLVHHQTDLVSGSYVLLHEYSQQDSDTKCEIGLLRGVDKIGFSVDVSLQQNPSISPFVNFLVKEAEALTYSHLLSLSLKSECVQGYVRNDFVVDCTHSNSTSYHIRVNTTALSQYSGARVKAYVDRYKRDSPFIQLPYNYQPNDVLGSLLINGKNVSTELCNETIEGEDIFLEFYCESFAKPCVIEIVENNTALKHTSHAVYQRVFDDEEEIILTIKYANCRFDGEHHTINCSIRKHTNMSSELEESTTTTETLGLYTFGLIILLLSLLGYLL